MARFPASAKVVIIGQGGIVGASVVHHLIERGWTDIVGIDKSAIPTDIGSSAHASDFCFTTALDHMTVFTTTYSIDFYEKMGRYAKVGGLEVARVDDDARMAELKRRECSSPQGRRERSRALSKRRILLILVSASGASCVGEGNAAIEGNTHEVSD